MTAAERRWTPLVRPLVILLVLVTVVGDAGPLRGTPPVLVTLELAGDVAEQSTVFPSSSAETTSPTLRTSPPTAVPTPTPTAVPTPTPTPGGICADPHAHRDQDGVCSCNSGYLVTRDDESFPNNTCRRSSGGYLGSRCSDISDCNYAIQHVACDDTCQCIKPYVGFNGETTCFDNAMGWGVAIKTAGITVLVLAVGFFIAFGVKGCTRSVRRRMGRRVPWLRRNSDISFNSADFFVGGLSQAILDRPPSYAEEDVDKPPAYEDLFPEDGVDNAAFSPDSPSGSQPPPQRHHHHHQPPQRQPAAAAAAADLSAGSAVSQPVVVVRGHRRGLSGPAAIHLGTADQTERVTAEQASQVIAEQTGQVTAEHNNQVTEERTGQVTAELGGQATAEQTGQVTVEQNGQAAAEQTVELNSQAVAEQSDQNVTEEQNQKTPVDEGGEMASAEDGVQHPTEKDRGQKLAEETASAVTSERDMVPADPSTTADGERSDTASTEQTVSTASEQTSAVPTAQASGVASGQCNDTRTSTTTSDQADVITSSSEKSPISHSPRPGADGAPRLTAPETNSRRQTSGSDGPGAPPTDRDLPVEPTEVWEDVQL